MSKLSPEQAEALRRKKEILNAGEGGYTPMPHKYYRKRIDDMAAKYGKTNARDALSIYALLCAYVNGESDKDTYMWAFLTVSQIADKLGIDRNRVKPLCDILEQEALLYTEMKATKHGRKKFYMPLL